MEWLGFEVGEILTRQVIYLVVIFLLGIILLYIATGILNFKKRSFGKAAGVLIAGSIFSFLLAFIPYIGRILGFGFLLKKFMM